MSSRNGNGRLPPVPRSLSELNLRRFGQALFKQASPILTEDGEQFHVRTVCGEIGSYELEPTRLQLRYRWCAREMWACHWVPEKRLEYDVRFLYPVVMPAPENRLVIIDLSDSDLFFLFFPRRNPRFSTEKRKAIFARGSRR